MIYFKPFMTKLRPAFTMIELLFVIIVIGILASMAIPRIDRDLRQEAGDNILSAIRYTQSLALNDDKTNPFDTNWQQKFWMIRFTGGENAFYTVSSDTNKNGAVNKIECAIDPINGKYMYNSSGAFSSIANDESANVFLGHKYGIDSVTAGGSCSAQHIAFDQLGRTHSGLITTASGTPAGNDYATYLNSDCTMTFGFIDDSIDDLVITISKETGYASIVGQPDS